MPAAAAPLNFRMRRCDGTPMPAWSVESSIRIGRKLLSEQIDLEYLEDPTWNLEGMSQVRQAVPIPLATNMCLVNYEQLAPGIRLRSVDIILADVHFWGGFRENQRMIAVCDAFQLGVGLHSDRELGVSTRGHAPLGRSVAFHAVTPSTVIITTRWTT